MTETLFPTDEFNQSQLPKRIRDMLAVHGAKPGRKCGECLHFARYKQVAVWSKCTLARTSASYATDWRTGWPACGQFQERQP